MLRFQLDVFNVYCLCIDPLQINQTTINNLINLKLMSFIFDLSKFYMNLKSEIHMNFNF